MKYNQSMNHQDSTEQLVDDAAIKLYFDNAKGGT